MGNVVDRELTVDTPPDEVWPALVEPDRLGDWMGADVELDLRPGGRATFRFDDGEVRHGLVETVDEEHVLGFTWWPVDDPSDASRVTITLDGDETGTVIRFRESRTLGLRAAA